MILKRKGQSIIEYALLVTLVLAAIVAVNTYVARAIKGRQKAQADQIGEQFTTNRDYTINNTEVSKRHEQVNTAAMGQNEWSRSQTEAGGGFDIIAGMTQHVPAGYAGHEVTVKNVTGFDSGNISATNALNDN